MQNGTFTNYLVIGFLAGLKEKQIGHRDTKEEILNAIKDYNNGTFVK